MPVVDVDTHWEVTRFEGDHPLAGFEERLPRPLEHLAFALAGDLLAALPPERRPSPAELLPHLVAQARDQGSAPAIHPRHHSSAASRIEWMDAIGVDQALVNPGGYWQWLEFLGPDKPRAIPRCNDFLADQLADQAERLHAVTVVDLADVDGAVAELERMRRKGSRAFFLYSVNGRPPADRSPGHPALDPVWSAATDLGMVAVIHVGNTSADFGGWADNGWDQPGGSGVEGLLRFANSERIHVAEMMLNSLVFGGVFARHPTLTVLLEEMRVGWMPWFVNRVDAQTRPSPALGPWPFELSGGQMLRRNVRITPLIGFGDTDAFDVMAQLPEMCVFSSDYPHAEGNADPVNLYQPRLGELDAATRDWFLGGNMADCFARMNDALV